MEVKEKKAQDKYNASKKGKTTRKRYEISKKGKEVRKKALKKYSSTEKGKATMRRYYATKKGKATKKRAQSRYILNNPEKVKAHYITAYYLPNKSCSIRGCNKKGEKHHEDYLKPLEVLYLCHKHHRNLKHC